MNLPDCSTPDYGQSFSRWRAAAAEPWLAYTRHDFVERLGNGTLPEQAFLTYLVQDYHFLIHFARAWALAVVKAGSLAEMQAASRTVNALLEYEMALHVETCRAAGIDHAEMLAAKEAPENLAYTRYVLEAGYSGDFLDLLAALAPCVLGYGEIGARLLSQGRAGRYAPWVATYGGAEYQDLCRATGALIDDAVSARLGDAPETLPRWGQLAARFDTATRLEVAFWGLGR